VLLSWCGVWAGGCCCSCCCCCNPPRSLPQASIALDLVGHLFAPTAGGGSSRPDTAVDRVESSVSLAHRMGITPRQGLQATSSYFFSSPLGCPFRRLSYRSRPSSCAVCSRCANACTRGECVEFGP